MKILKLVLLAALLASPMAFAGDSALEGVKKVLSKLMPKAKPDSVKASAIPGIFQAVYGAQIVYISGDGRYMMEGDIYDLKTRVNLTENLRQGGRIKAVSGIDEASMIVFKPKEGKVKHTLTIFTDIDCGYCRKLHDQVKQYNKKGIELRYLAYPRSGVNTKSYFKAEKVWCAVDRNKAMNFAKGGAKLEQLNAIEQVKGKDCGIDIQKHMAIAKEVGVTGTPTLVMENGRVLPGYVPPDRLIKILDTEG